MLVSCCSRFISIGGGPLFIALEAPGPCKINHRHYSFWPKVFLATYYQEPATFISYGQLLLLLYL